jgi:hypothetical protein
MQFTCLQLQAPLIRLGQGQRSRMCSGISGGNSLRRTRRASMGRKLVMLLVQPVMLGRGKRRLWLLHGSSRCE